MKQSHFSNVIILTVLMFTGIAKAESIKIYIATNGDDQNSGETATQAFKTIAQAQENLKNRTSLKPGDNIEILFQKGVYLNQSVIWDIDLDSVNFYFKPATAEDVPVIFDGRDSKVSNFFTVRYADEKYKNKKISTNLHFDRIVVRNYCNGISFGDAYSKAFINNNSVTNSTFAYIGSRYDSVYKKTDNIDKPKGDCVAAIRTNKALFTKIQNNKFYKILNLPSSKTASNRYGPGSLHAIYLSQHSSNTIIQNNKFDTFSGTPIRIRNQSNDIKIINNSFQNPFFWSTRNKPNANNKATNMEAISQWYCNDSVEKCVRLTRMDECLSTGIEISNNKFGASLIPYANVAQNHKCVEKIPTLNKAFNTPGEVILKN